MRVADNVLDQLVAAFLVAIGVADAEGLGMDVLEAGNQVALFFVDEAGAIGDQQLHVASLGMVDGGVVDLVEDAVGDGEPDAAGGGVGRADGVFDA